MTKQGNDKMGRSLTESWMKPEDVSVIIPTYKSLDLLKRTIGSLERQQPDPVLFEVVVVDDGSKDSTGKWLQNYSGPLRLKAVVLLENRGRSAARNIGVSSSTCPLLLFVDGDMEFDPDFVSSHAACHFDGSSAVIGRVVYDRSFGCRGYTRYLESRGIMKLKPGEPVPGRYFLAGNASLSRKVFNYIGGFDEYFRVYGEDIDFGMRLAEAGVTLKYRCDLIVHHLHVRPLRFVLKIAEEYGRKSVGELIKRHPELYRQLKLNWLERPDLLDLIRRMILSAPVYNVALVTARCLNNFRAPALLYSYLLFRSYYYGYKQSLHG